MEFSILIALVIALTSAIKTAAVIDKKFVPLLSIVIAIVMAWLFGDVFWTDAISTGLIAGLSASGLYSGAKASVGK